MEEIVHPENLNAGAETGRRPVLHAAKLRKPVGDRFYMGLRWGNRSATGSTWGEVGAGGGGR